ncbi:SDR family oxidoreductase [Roseicella frigidaeris]|uniref:Short-chain dehydrogenase n=1 Tax=Roseicella frigidaeris TaxID=2230885 RepID=A0A327MF90_9PROT|nr:SDR family oxidoreductase [Roseicella frigidaeris]RAI61076.1 short-chain dehydrogenase [Roseicella frigidaeris]
MASITPRRAAPGAVVITGASAGVGRATARAFARRGFDLALIARGTEGLEAARREAEAAGVRAIALPADTADAAGILAAADRAAEVFGGIGTWVNAAMATTFAPVHDTRPEEYRRVTEVTYLGYVHGTLAALRHMRPRNAGTIVQVGSALAYRAIPLQSAYCAAKFAIRGFTDSLRSELQHEGSRIRLTMVQLPAVNTPQFDWARSHMPRRAQPVPPIHQPEPVAERIVQAALTAPRELWVGGATVKAILGTMLAPGLVDRLLARQGYDGQMTQEPEPPGRPDNLMTPWPGDQGAHGRFDARARDRAMAVDPDWLRAAAGLALGLLLPLAWQGLTTPGQQRHGPPAR